jgi:hypothetical protein
MPTFNAALDRVIDGAGLRRIDCNQCRDADQQHRQILLHLQVPKTIACAARNSRDGQMPGCANSGTDANALDFLHKV